MRTNYMMTVDDVMEELGVKRSGKIPRPYWETKFYGCSQRAV